MDWLHCDIEGALARVATTYHSLSDGWYLLVPEAWVGRVFTLAMESGLNESQVTFRVDDKIVASVYAITGENRENRALRGDRTVLRRRTDIVYAGEVQENSLEFDKEQLRSSFRLIVSSWAS